MHRRSFLAVLVGSLTMATSGAALAASTVSNEAQADALAEETLEIADDGKNDWMLDNDPDNPGYKLNGEHVQRSRLRVDARKWFASKVAPKKYGEKVEQTVTATGTFVHEIRETIVDPKPPGS